MDIQFIRDSVLYSEVIATIAGTIFYYKYKNTHLKYLLYLLWFIVIIELIGGYMVKNKVLVYIDGNGLIYNKWIHNILKFVTFSTLYYIYYKSIDTKKMKQWIKFLSIVFTVIYILNWVFIQNFIKESPEIPRVVGSVFLIVCIIFYFVELLRSEKIVVFYRVLLFWISIGLLLFYTGTIPFTLKYNGYSLIKGIHELFLIVYLLAISMYLIFTFGFIWSKKEGDLPSK